MYNCHNRKDLVLTYEHSSVAFTMDVYSHIIKEMQEDAMALLDEVIPAGINKISVANFPVIMIRIG